MIVPDENIERFISASNAVEHLVTIPSLSGTSLKLLQQPVIYMWRRDAQYLYIGCSMRGVARFLNKHERLAVLDTDVIEFVFMPGATKSELEKVEYAWILKYLPIYNKAPR